MKKREDKKVIGDFSDPRCHQNAIKVRDRKYCKTNCRYWRIYAQKDGKFKKKCLLGY